VVRRAWGLTAVVLACLWASACPGTLASPWAPASAAASPSVRLGASFTPYRLGGRTTIGFAFQISGSGGQLPSALTDVDIRYPENLGIVLSGLGLADCTQVLLQNSGCPPNSTMGYGSTLAEMRFGQETVEERARITIARAEDEEGHIALLLYAVGPSPVDTQILSPAQLVPAAAPFGGRLNIELPLVPSVPGAPDVAIVQMHATLGPLGVTYIHQVAGEQFSYTPKGILLPDACPRGGFRFAAEFTFLDGSHPTARTTVPCPRHSR
jgi:hypothetical protein